jgi:hypothetical protein
MMEKKGRRNTANERCRQQQQQLNEAAREKKGEEGEEIVLEKDKTKREMIERHA